MTATRYSLAQLELNVTTSWYPWYHKDEVHELTHIELGDTWIEWDYTLEMSDLFCD